MPTNIPRTPRLQAPRCKGSDSTERALRHRFPTPLQALLKYPITICLSPARSRLEAKPLGPMTTQDTRCCDHERDSTLRWPAGPV